MSSNHDDAWSVVGASMTGTGHEQASLPCQDAHAWQRLGDDWVVITAADGAGSARISQIGARVAVDCAVARLAERIGRHLDGVDPLDGADAWQGALREVGAACLTAVQQEAAARQHPVGDLACTLLMAVLGPSLRAAAHIGDGAIVVENEDGTIALLTAPDCGENLNETTFLISPDAVSRARFSFAAQPARSVAMFTDGIQMLTLEYRTKTSGRSASDEDRPIVTWNPFLPFFNHVFAFFRRQDDSAAAEAALKGMLTSFNVRDGTDDDVTLVVACRRQRADATLKEIRAEESALGST